MKKLLFALSAFALVATACNKDDEDPAEVTTENIAGTYKFVSLKLRSGNGPDVDITSQMDACEIDDTQTFNTNGTYNYADAGTQCSPAGDYSGTWSLQNTTTIIMDGDSYTIKSFDGDKLEISYSETDQGVTYTSTVMLDKQ
jgi:hypothetical protein